MNHYREPGTLCNTLATALLPTDPVQGNYSSLPERWERELGILTAALARSPLGRRRNVIVLGLMHSGKSSFLNSLLRVMYGEWEAAMRVRCETGGAPAGKGLRVWRRLHARAMSHGQSKNPHCVCLLHLDGIPAGVGAAHVTASTKIIGLRERGYGAFNPADEWAIQLVDAPHIPPEQLRTANDAVRAVEILVDGVLPGYSSASVSPAPTTALKLSVG